MSKKRKERENRTIKLTARTVDSLKPDPERQLDYFDQDLKSFCVRVSPSGHKSFCVFYRRGRQLRRHTLGSYPVLTLAQAREKAKDALHEAHHGADPGEEKQRARQAATFAELSEQYIERYAKKKKRTWEEDQRIVNKYLLPEFEHVTANDLSRASVRSLLEENAED